jgi:hypothetical protein
MESPDVSDEEKPIAVCQSSMDTLAPLRESATLYGDESYDPKGLDIIEYTWRLVEQPSGSGIEFSGVEANRYGFTPDLAGEYTFELVVTNEECVKSDPCQVALTAIPMEELWVELSWEMPGDDMDLHLIKEDALFESEGDCYYGNCVSDGFGGMLDWGRMGSVEDDPRLDLDDIEGRGPENINISEPAEGSYRVVVHDYPGSVYSGANTTTVRIHLGGEMVFEKEVAISGEDSRTEVAIIDWPSMEVRSSQP